MSKYRFSWAAFDDDTVSALASAVRGEPTADVNDARTWLTESVKRPNDGFVKTTKPVLENVWLRRHPEVARAIVDRLVDAGIGPLTSPSHEKERLDYIRSCRNAAGLRHLLMEALLRFGDQDADSTEAWDGDVVRRYVVLNPKKYAHPDPREPHNYQMDAWNRLTAHRAESSGGAFRGLLVMPTGSGKTFTTVHWLMENIVNGGGHVLWLAHRHELLEQAAREFHVLGGLATTVDRLRVRIVSGRHCASVQIDPEDHVVVASVQSLAQRPDVVDMLLANPKLFLVVDEAHHASAKSYKDIINKLARTSRPQILGITATPTRTIDRERGDLTRLFGEKFIHQVEMQKLIFEEFLAQPLPTRVSTKASVDRGVTKEDEEYLARFNDLSEEWLDRIAHLEERNQVIVREYLQHPEYGKTLVFAVNVAHAALLTERFRKAGIKADYVASYRPDLADGETRYNKAIVDQFRAETDGLQVLVNVQILTEGVDLPAVQTVFLARPTQSEILVRQMIGRALRGPKMGGTKTANIVSFEDHWEIHRGWQSPFDLVPDIMTLAPTTDEQPVAVPKVNEIMDRLPWDLIRSVADAIRRKGIEFAADAFEAIPNGWYCLERVADGETVRQVIPVYQHQLPSWEALIQRLQEMSHVALAALDPEREFDEYFSAADCEHPWPAIHEIRQMVEHFRAGGERPKFIPLEERRTCDPEEIALEIRAQNLRHDEGEELIASRYTPLARAIYPTLRDFEAAINDADYELRNPGESTRRVRATPVFLPTAEKTLQPGPHHDLGALMDRTLKHGQTILGLAEPLPREFTVRWTTHFMTGWFGLARWERGSSPGSGEIKINRVLDSPDIEPSTLEFLLWHEYLHIYLQQVHTKEFRTRERKWPGLLGADRALLNLRERFNVTDW